MIQRFILHRVGRAKGKMYLEGDDLCSEILVHSTKFSYTALSFFTGGEQGGVFSFGYRTC